MSSLPIAARMRQQAAMKREMALQQRAYESGRLPLPQQNRLASTNRISYRDRSADFLTARELEEALEKRTTGGKNFRNYFIIISIMFTGLLIYAKYDVEMNIEVPQIESGKGFGEVKDFEDDNSVSSEGSAYRVSREEMDPYLNVLGIKSSHKQPTEEGSSSKEGKKESDNKEDEKKTVSAERQRMRDQWELKKRARAAREEHDNKYGQLVSCGRACQDNHKQIEAASAAIESMVPRDIYKTLYGSSDTRKARRVNMQTLQETYEKQKARIEKEETDEEDKKMYLAELKDAYDIARSPEARAYYHLYGRKPTESMKATSARHGGWGQELYLGTYKHRMIMAVLDYFSNSWAETCVLGAIALLLLARLPSIINQTMKMQAVLEAQDALDAQTEERERAN